MRVLACLVHRAAAFGGIRKRIEADQYNNHFCHELNIQIEIPLAASYGAFLICHKS